MDILESKVQKRFIKNLNKREPLDILDTAKRLSSFLVSLSPKQYNVLLGLLKQVQIIQQKNINIFLKSKKIKEFLWTKQSLQTKLLTGKISATIVANLNFGTGRIEDAGLAGAYDVWGFLASELGMQLLTATIELVKSKKYL
ncbi:MAG: hypothetical protein L3J74_11850 [Bacteroidales bacterium]|nr:hypothetical protein [Bacteroidales bacterium]